MIDTLFNQYFGSLDFSTYEGICQFILGSVVLVGVFNLLKIALKSIFK